MSDEKLNEELNEEDFFLTAEEAFSLRESEVETANGTTARLSYIVCEPLEEAASPEAT